MYRAVLTLLVGLTLFLGEASNSHAEKMELICNLDSTQAAKTNWNVRDYVGNQENFIFDESDLTVSFSNFGKIYVSKFDVISHSNAFVNSGKTEKGLYWESEAIIGNSELAYQYFLFVSEGVLEITVTTPTRVVGPIFGNCGSQLIQQDQAKKKKREKPEANEDDLLNDWQQRNQWFGSNKELTDFAMSLHQNMVASGRVKIGSVEYYSLIDREMRIKFPVQFETIDNSTFIEIGELANSGNVQRALTLLRPIAKAGNSKALAALGYHYSVGLGVEKNFKLAFDYYSTAAAAGNVHAMYGLGVAYQNGDGVVPDKAKAASWYNLVLKFGDEPLKQEATRALGSLGDVSEGVNQPDELRIKFQITKKEQSDSVGLLHGTISTPDPVLSLIIDGSPINLAPDGSFTWTGYIPPTGKTLVLKMISGNSNVSFEVVEFEASKILDGQPISFDSLNPTNGKLGESNSNSIALIIGIENYENTPSIALHAENDALQFRDFARFKLGVSEERIKILTGNDAGIKGILLGLRDWLGRLVVSDETDVYIFFAGHGLSADDGSDMYLLPSDGVSTLLTKTALSRNELIEIVQATNPRAVTLFFDTCYSGLTRSSDTLINARPLVIRAKEQAVPDGFTVMTAAAGDQTAKPLEEAKHGMFSYFLMKGMEGDADANQDNQITAGELHAYVQQNVIQQSSGSQTPELQGDADRVLVRFQ